MVNNRCYDEIAGQLTPEHFYIPLHAAVFEAIERIINTSGVEANPINIAQQLKSTTFNAQNDL